MSSECVSGLDILRGMQTHAGAQRLPLAGSLALTHRCNFKCVHCYAARPVLPPELGTGRLTELVDEMSDAGCLFLLITGGEPLIHPDFKRLYARIRERGMLVSVFTNGSRIDDETIELFRDLPPRMVDVTLYGYSEETYRAVTGVAGMRERVWRAVERMMENGIRVAVKTVVLSINQHEFHDIQAQAKAWGLRFRMDAMLFGRLNGDRSPLQYRLHPEAAAALEFSDAKRTEQWKVYGEKFTVSDPDSRLYRCAAGVWSFHLDPAGSLQPCLMASHIAHNVAHTPFMEGWKRLTADMSSRKVASNSQCASCDKRAYCGYCPPFAHLESGDECSRSDYLCLIGSARSAKVLGM